jgi:predicted ATPase
MTVGIRKMSLMKLGLPAEPALVGRDVEIRQLLWHFDSALNGKGSTVFVFGEAGVGKTRLINEFLIRARKMEVEVLCGWCLSEAGIPYFPFTEAFNTYISGANDTAAKSTVKKQLGIMGWLKGTESTKESMTQELFSTPEIERDKTFEAVSRVLVELSARKPLILFLDDLQWADHLSLALVHYLSRKCRNSKLLIIGTYRPEETVQTEEGRLHPLEETIFAMSREDLLVKMELKSLKREDLSELVRSVFRASVDEAFVEKLYKETEGNPLFAIETLNLIVEEGFLSRIEGQWTLTAPAEKMRIPSKIQEVIIRRIRRLRREERRLLDLAAVCGNSFNPNVMGKLMSSDVADVLRTLVEIEQKHMLIRPEDSTFEFTHHRIREVIYESLPSELRKVYHLKTAGCLEEVLAKKSSDSWMADIAFHYVEGGAPEKAFEYLLSLGEKALSMFANLQAIEYLNEALEAARKVPSLATKENLARIYLLRGRAWFNQVEMAKASSDFDQLLQAATSLGDQSMVAEAQYWLGFALTWVGEIDEAKPHLVNALEIARKIGNKHLEAGSLLELTEALLVSPDTMEEARNQAEQALRICRETNDTSLESGCLFYLGFYHDWKGEFDKAQVNVEQAAALAEKMDDRRGRMFALILSGLVLAGEGEYNTAIAALQKSLQLSHDWGIVFYVPRALNILGWIYHDLECLELAMKSNNQGLEIIRTNQERAAGVAGVAPACLINLGMDHLHEKDYENARKYLQEAKGLVHLHPMARWRFETRVYLGLGEISLAEGDYGRALRSTEESLKISEKAGAKKYIAKGWKLKSEILEKTGGREEAIELMQKALGLALELGNPPLIWQIHFSLGALLEKQGKKQEASRHYDEALALIEKTASRLNDPSLRNTLMARARGIKSRLKGDS